VRVVLCVGQSDRVKAKWRRIGCTARRRPYDVRTTTPWAGAKSTLRKTAAVDRDLLEQNS